MSRNLLDQETSPYLLQHKDNPVHWQAWGEAPMAEARRLNRPILLSIGYAACHWCHVMAHESFEDPAIARVMNELFVCVKVDREERPDVDTIYQAALAMTGQPGGWPLTMFLTADGNPFWGGTYFPPTARWGRPAFTDVLLRISQVFHTQKDTVAGNVGTLREALEKLGKPAPGAGFSPEVFDLAATTALRLVDSQQGGTAGAPKFPQPVFFRLLWRTWRRTRAPEFREAVTLTLDSLCRGGIYDHIGGGFARYSTDAEWLVPHFEKMLYDNAQLIELLTEVWLETGSPLYAARIRETIAWLLREMRVDHPSKDGSFALASALDADSEGVEGRFYVWSAAEITAVLGADAARFSTTYDISPAGNWEGSNIPNLNRCGDVAATLADPLLAGCRARLLDRRAARVRPGIDDKVLADWNGLAISALVRAASAFDEPAWLDAARKIFAFVADHMHESERLRHTWRCGAPRHLALLDDYANLARAVLALYQATSDAAYLHRAREWTAAADRHYLDPDDGGYFLSADDTTDVIVRSKPIIDTAVPSGNGTMLEVLARLWLHTGIEAYRARAERLAQLFSGDEPQYLVGVSGLIASAEFLTRSVQVVVVGDGDAAAALRDAALASANPLIVLSRHVPGERLPETHPAFAKTPVDGLAAAYVCRGTTCSPPYVEPDALRQALGSI
jgi:uncharacterized protein YyaL (SSP411 family)